MRRGWVIVLVWVGWVSAWAADVPTEPDWAGVSQPVRLAPEKDYGPFIFENADGRIDGLSMDVLALLQARMNLRVQPVPARSLRDQLVAVQAREADLLTSLRPTPERGRYLLFTRPYVSVPAVLVVAQQGNSPRLADFAGRRVAVGQGYAVETWIRGRHPLVHWQPVSDDAVALRGLAEGRFHAAVMDQASFRFLSRRLRLGGLRVAGDVGFEYPLSFAVRSDWPALHRALDDAIGALPRSARDAVLLRWLQEGRGSTPAAARRDTLVTLGMAMAVSGLVLLIVLERRRRARSAEISA